MPGRKCFICNEPNYNGNETIISVKRLEIDYKTGARRTIVWSGMVCDKCLHEYLGEIGKAAKC